MLSLEVEAVGVLAMALLIGSYPDGVVERGWQRLALRCLWVSLLGPPLALLASPDRASVSLGHGRASLSRTRTR